MADSTETQATEATRGHCGVIMPISASDGYPAEHWADVLRLIKESATRAGFSCDMVSGATSENDIIHANIITSIYNNQIAVCDVSSRNPNVMLELGLRLASKKPVIIIFDGEGSYPFDINAIRYVRYRRDMRYYDTQKFKRELTTKLMEVDDAVRENRYQSFLSQFKEVSVELDTVGSETQSLKEFLERMNGELTDIKASLASPQRAPVEIGDYIDPSVLYTYFSVKLRAMDLYAPLTSAEIDKLGEMLNSRYHKELANAPISLLYNIVDTMVNPYLRSQGRVKP
jgi:hypothetical protein